MSYQPDSLVTSPGATDHDPTWQLHSSTDSYLQWDATTETPVSNDQPPAQKSTSSASSPMSGLRFGAPAVRGQTPAQPPSTDSASALPHLGHTTSPDRPVSPSYFSKFYFQAPHRSSSATSPTITFTQAPSEPSLVASTQPLSLLPDGAPSVSHPADPVRQRRSSVSAAASSPTAPSATPLSPTISNRSTGGGGFFASLRPSSPSNISVSSSKTQDGDSFVKPRRPSSVFEHVGNVWERFGRKVHHTRTGISEQQPTSSSHARRSASQASPSIGLTPEAADPFDVARTSSSGSSTSQASPSQSTATESECRTPATPGGEAPAAVSTLQPIPSAPAYASVSAADLSIEVPNSEEIEELPYLTPESPALYGQSSAAVDSPRISSGQRSHTSHRRTSSLFERVLIQVTDDNERFSVVDISGVDSADAIKERMFAKLHLFDADHSGFQLFRTEIGQSEATGPVVSDDALLVLCLQMGDDRGTLKFLVQQTAPPPNSTVRAMPPPTSTSDHQRALNEVRRTSGTGSSASHHLRTGSQSSKSSLSDAFVFPEMFGADGSHEGSNRNSGSSLMRSKAQARRVLPSAPGIDDLRSPTHCGPNAAAQSSLQDRRSIASSGEGSANESWTRHSGSASEGTPSLMLTQRSSSNNASAPAPPSSTSSGRRPSYIEEDRPRIEAESRANRSLFAPANGSGHRQERSDEGARLGQASGLTLHNARSMDDLHRPLQPASQSSAMTSQAEVRKQAGMDRDGRYPAPTIMRPSTAAPAGPGAPGGGSGHRQYSSDVQGSVRVPVDPSTSLDARVLHRNRSAQAAIPSSQQLVSHGPIRMSSTSQMRSPPMPNGYVAQGQLDPRFNAQPPHPAHTMQARPASMVGRPQYAASPTYGGQPQHQAQSYGQATQRSMGPGYVNEFGARAPNAAPTFNTYHGHDPRLNANVMQGSLTPRPYSYHEQPAMHHHPGYRPYPQQNLVATSTYRTREDPFTTRYFPASSSRQVSEFQMQAGRLEPGMTIQQTLRTQEVIRNAAPVGSPGQPYQTPHPHPPGPSYGPRDPRQPAQSNQYAGMQGYANTSAPPHLQQRPGHQGSALPNLHQQPTPRPQPFLSTPAPSQHAQSPLRPTTASHASSQPRPHSSSSSSGRGPTQQQPGPESHRRDPPIRTNASERSSGSSFSSQASSQQSQHGRPSHEDRNSRASVEDSFSAPTSARSSQSGPAATKPSNSEHRSSYADHDRDLADDELAQIRPLPKLPSSSATTPTESSNSRPASINKGAGAIMRKSEDEDTLRAGEWAQLWRALDPQSDGTVIGTAVSGSSGGDGDTVRADPSTPGPTRPQTKDGHASSISLKPPRAASSSMAPEGNGTVASFASFGTFDDDESESGTWAQPLDSDANAPRLPLRLNADEEKSPDDHATLLPGEASTLLHAAASGPSTSPKRPELRLTIDPAAGPTLVTPNLQQPSNSPHPSSSLLSSALSGGITRSNSFARRDDDWAFRPPPEQLYENLDDFFPKHDLDKPLLDTAAVPESPMVGSPRSEAAMATSPPSISSFGPAQALSARSRHKKSIRLVAQDRKRILERAEKKPSAQDSEPSSRLVRRRSTKLWGTKVVEMTPGQELSTPASATSAESPSSDASSQKPVFKWVKGDLIGKGTYGRVYLALNATTGEMIAVKQVELPRTASDREDSRQKGVVAALKSEIETLKDLDHPHIVSYLGFEETTSFLSIFLEYVPGGSVGSCLRKHGKFEEHTIKSFLHQILEGLAYLHSKGILHRDLKADNILVDFEGICKISDFGTVRRSDDIYGNVENMSLQGSIFWMAPEVVSLSKKGYSAKIDIWSLGCVVLEMFAGRRPWSDDEAVQAMFKIGAERKAPPIPADVKLSKQAAHFLKNCFEVDPAKRPTAQRLLDHVFSVPDDSWHFQQSALWRSLQR
ncbi:related to BCK1 ser/thr protein kinase of the MEKK family [Melanopsichium pennsylvanicum]|uniref:Related to BCK1 ser/thr protein kinase of the MEKK family n=2 Tax=Melanopsichium pennsylvanicum TaxID=63383 RepID=A0AAJ4XIW8_9BASI|nr:related to BCK1 ser/thr protein kinase of the MEKK family [Melanopsichium pennsylvanicum 4]SNX83227.1 related to BCK1 ser/thr protein kinase of the MEKK family [Melanopsichium pennsylvanicum]